MNIKKYILPALAVALLSACNQEEINTNRHGISDESLRSGGLAYGTALMDMQQQLFPIGAPSETTGPGNDLQATDLISSGNYIGYFGNNNNWNFNIEASWNFPDHRVNYIFNQLYTDVAKSWTSIYLLAKDSEAPADKQVLALADIVKIAAWLRATDSFGPIVYTTAGDGNITPTPESQQVVYKAMLADLSECVTVLQGVSRKILPQYDLVYDGDAKKWIKFANSIMLRMAVRVHFVDQALAQEYITKALDPANGGVIESIADEAKVGSSSKLPLLNPYLASVEDYGETRMGATIWAYLDGYKDPRLDKYFTKGVRDLAGRVPFHWPLPPTSDKAKDYAESFWRPSRRQSSKPKVASGDPVYWFRASETFFLKAEAVLYNLTTGNAKDLYETGVKTSFAEQGLSASEATTYLAQGSGVQVTSLSPANSFSGFFDDMSIGNVTPQWDHLTKDNATEEQLQKIITQKYLALYPNAIEAWTEYRRTGYPYIFKPEDSQAPARVGAKYGELRAPERFRFPASSYTTNPNNAVIPSLLGGEDQGKTKLWWVRADRPELKY